MSDSPVKSMVMAALVLGAAGYYFSLDDEAKTSGAQMVLSLMGKSTAKDANGNIVVLQPDPVTGELRVPAAPEPEPAVAPQPQSASVVSLPRTNGQFFTQARVNSGSVRFLVDTGASSVALTLDDARRAGIDPRALRYDVPVHTANGRTMAAAVTLKDVQIGGIRVRNVEGLVLNEGLHISLLGMTFLGQLQKVEATSTQMIMRL